MKIALLINIISMTLGCLALSIEIAWWTVGVMAFTVAGFLLNVGLIIYDESPD